MGRFHELRWMIPLLAGLALVGSSVACGAGQFRLRSAGAEPALTAVLTAEAPIAAATGTDESTVAPTPTFAPSPTTVPTAAPVKIAVVQVQALRLRGGAGTGHPVVGGLKLGDKLVVLGENGDRTWLNVRNAAGVEGWVAANYVTVTEEAAPDANPVATPAPGSQAPGNPASAGGGLNVARRDVQSFYEELGFYFASGKAADGRDQLKGSNHSGQATVILLGPDDNLSGAAITAATRFDQETMILSAAYLQGFAGRVMPGWIDGSQWVEAHLREARNGVAVSTTAGAIPVRLWGDAQQVSLVFGTD